MSGLVNRASQWGPKVKKIVLATVLLAAGSASAYSADLPARTYTKASVVEVAYNWSGFYLGANAGYGFSHRAVNYGSSNEVGQGLIFPEGTTTDFSPQPPTALNPRGVIGGGQIGYNWQFDSQWLIGVEADFGGSAIRASGNQQLPAFHRRASIHRGRSGS